MMVYKKKDKIKKLKKKFSPLKKKKVVLLVPKFFKLAT